MVNRKMLALLLTSAPYGSQYADHMCRVALRALERGYAVEILLYGQAVRSQMESRSPEGLFPVRAKIRDLMEKGAKVYGCDDRDQAPASDDESAPIGQDQPSREVPEGIERVPVSKLVDILVRADRVLSFGGG